ncbi:MAG: NUDIX domain-containing protein [Clostridiales bacterium]|nr:NUDIX domain-containing protein [Clostridiales bacterium]
MNDLNRQKEEAYLASYDISTFERPSIAADIAIFSILNADMEHNIRKLTKKALKILLIKRASHPFKDCWALPGGFCKPGEDVIETARRELREETNVENAYLQLVGAFGAKDRDPRGWIVSNTFMALMDGEQCNLRAGTDAWEAKWFQIDVEGKPQPPEVTKEEVVLVTDYDLELTNEQENMKLTASLREKRVFKHFHETVSYEILSSENLAFDHAKIILNCLLALRSQAKENTKMVFDLMPEKFTLTQLQNSFEIILNQKLVPANFRRKIADYVVETDEIIEGTGYRPAKLFRRNLETFYQ